MRANKVMRWMILGLAVTANCPVILAADEPLRLRETFAPGYQYHVSVRVEITGTLTPPAEKGKSAPKPLAVRGDSAIEYDERVLDLDDKGVVTKTARICRRIDFQRTVGDSKQEATIRPAVRRLILLRHNNQEVPFSPDGPLTWGEIDQVRTDVFTPALVGLLPRDPASVGDKWTAARSAIQELTDMERIEEGEVTCRLEQILTVEKRRQARVSFAGTVRGPGEDGTTQQKLDGFLYFDLESNHVSYVSLKGVHSLLDKDNKEVGRVEGRFVLSRQANTRCKELSDEGLKGVATEPNADNTLLLYDNPDLGVKFLHPRRWRVTGAHGNQVTLDSADGGGGVLLTVEPPSRTPTGAQFLTESREFLEKQKAKFVRVERPAAVQGVAGMEHFSIEAEMGGQAFVMDYYTWKQRDGGVIVAARLPKEDAAALQKEVERIARSATVTKKIEERK
jgi:hypothetical protein